LMDAGVAEQAEL